MGLKRILLTLFDLFKKKRNVSFAEIDSIKKVLIYT